LPQSFETYDDSGGSSAGGGSQALDRSTARRQPSRSVRTRDGAMAGRKTRSTSQHEPSSSASLQKPAVLPDDGVGDRPAGPAVPQDGGFALVGDADRRDVAGGQPGGLEGLAGRGVSPSRR
jgi:hypothetical protein